MGSPEENPSTNPSTRRPVARRGQSGDGDRPWLAVWLLQLERAMRKAGFPPDRQRDWKAALGNFLLEFRRHPARIAPAEIRDYLFRAGELGGAESPRSLPVATRALAFFYTFVLTRPALAQAARRPFEPFGFVPRTGAPEDAALFGLRREKRVDAGAPAWCAQDWTAVK